MKENFLAISNALKDAGFKQSLESSEGKLLDFKFTPYSLNTKLSFRFDNLKEFCIFLRESGHEIQEKEQNMIKAALLELGLKPDEFFYVNFFEKGKEFIYEE